MLSNWRTEIEENKAICKAFIRKGGLYSLFFVNPKIKSTNDSRKIENCVSLKLHCFLSMSHYLTSIPI